jgi:hypothetical protein
MRHLGVIPTMLVVLAAALAGCSSGDSGSDDQPETGASPSSAPSPPAPPRKGDCHELTLDEATDPVDPGETVPCGQPHTAVTYRVGQISSLADGHLLAVDSPTVRARIAEACPPALPAYLGGDESTFRLSRFEPVWFGPTLEEADAGADTFRCDVVALRREGTLLELPRKMKGVLDAPGALDRYGTCGTAAPDAKRFERVVCSEKHSWRAVDDIDLPKDARYLGGAVTATADAACKDVASERANGALQPVAGRPALRLLLGPREGLTVLSGPGGPPRGGRP